FSDVHGIVIHHTGSDAGQSDDYLDFLANRGRPGIPGPLCNASTDMDGDLWLVAQGRANHAGEGSSRTHDHVCGEDYDGYRAELTPGPDNIDGNAVYYGNEVRYDGGQPMTPKQYDSAIRWAAAICDHHGWSALSIIGHREHTGRKNDPGRCPMNQFRSDVAALLKAGPGGTSTPTKPDTPEEDMPLTEAEWTRLGKLLYAKNYEYGGDLWADPTGTGTKFIATTKAQLVALTTQVAGLTAAVKALAGQQGVDPDQVVAAVQAATKDALAELKITLAVDGDGSSS
ncbi:MAG TPA: peptidoglycan recognition family protein, partial [Kribbella sp.]|nr:peptidoglycan recognition family protein [Kribbella sp.]